MNILLFIRFLFSSTFIEKATIVERKSDRNFVNVERKKKSMKLFDNSIAASKSA